MTRVLIDEVISEVDYNGNPITDPEDFYKFQNHLILMGGIRLRQYRVQSDECTYREQAFKCYNNRELKETMQMPNLGHDIEWTSRSENEETPYYRGAFRSYPGSGFVVMLPRDRERAMGMISALKQDLWIDGHTRMISIDFNLFNPSTGLHTVARIVFEFGESAATTPSRAIRTWRFMRYENNLASKIFDICFTTFVLFTVISELREYLCAAKCCKFQRDPSYWHSHKYNVLDWGMCVLSLFLCLSAYVCLVAMCCFCASYSVCLAFNFVIGSCLLATWRESQKLDLVNREKYVSLLYIEYLLTVTNYFILICGQLLLVKVCFVCLFLYLSFSLLLFFCGLDCCVMCSLFFCSCSNTRHSLLDWDFSSRCSGAQA